MGHLLFEIEARMQKRFKKPTVEEVEAYCTERNNGIDALKFWHYYECRDWKIGGEKMKRWKSAVIVWEQNEKSRASSVRKGPNLSWIDESPL